VSNYPPGVTGNEPQIAGYPEQDMEVECGNSLGRFLGVHQVRTLLVEMQDQFRSMGVSNAGSPVAAMHEVLDALDDQEETVAACQWSGTVTAQIADGEAWWDCPMCGAEQSEEIETGPDPDDARELARDLAMDD
jgi:hypothetical protein